jgi:hypothetical protein
MCKEKLHDVLGGASGMTKAFQIVETALINVKGVTKTTISQMVGFEGVSRMDKLQVKWVFQKAQYKKAKPCLEHARGFVV